MLERPETPTSCPTCRGSAPCRRFLRCFGHTDYGHCRCLRCGITFDSNVNQLADLPEVSTARLRRLDEIEFKQRFVETSRISDEQGVIYPDFGFADNEAVQAGVTRAAIDSISPHFGAEDRFRLLDLGCGNGFTTRVLTDHYPNAEVFGLDPSPQVEEFASRLGFRGLQGTLDTIRLEAAELDVVVVLGNLMLHPDPFATLTEIRRILKPGGVLVFDVKNARASSRVASRLAIGAGLARLGGRTARYLERNFVNMRFGFNKTVVTSYLRELGFSEISVRSKPPRLLEFANASEYQGGLVGLVWRLMDRFDARRDERAWLHFSCLR